MTEYINCLKCGEKQAYFRVTTKDYRCGACGEVFVLDLAKDKVNEVVDEVLGEEKADKIVKLKMPKEQAKEAWKKYCEVLRTRKDKFLKIMKDAHYQMKEGRELIDVYEVMSKFGLTEKNEPVFAIARADISEVCFEKKDTGTGSFIMDTDWNRTGWNTDVHLPQKTFEIHWEREGDSQWSIKDKKIKTKVPIIPVELVPEGDLKNYYILWEAVNWETLPPPKDPILLKRISENLFAVLGCWDVTELERAVMRGLE